MNLTRSQPEPASDVWRASRRHPLDAIFRPKALAVIGATEAEGSVGRALMENLGKASCAVYPVNSKRSSVLGVRAYPSIAAVPQSVDLAVIATPAPTVPGVIAECVQAKVPGAIIISAGFRECGPAGAALEKQILAEARRGHMRVVGPNCLGVMAPLAGFNATFASAMARPGNVAFISQSGALCTAILDWSFRENVGFSAFISIGSMLDVDWGDLIGYFGDDPRTRSIVIYMESIGNARSFLSAAREVALNKPIIVIKVGRTEAASKAAASHTGSLTGSDEVLEAAFRRCGVLRVSHISDLFNMAEALAKQPRPRGPRLAIITNGGGPGALATDSLITHGGELAELSGESLAALNQLLPAHWSHGNPVDLLGDASPERYAKAVEIVARDFNNNGVLVILTPQAMTDATGTAEQLKSLAKLDGKPILTSWMGGAELDAARAILNEAKIPTFDYPDTAARAFQYMWRYSDNLRALYETPALLMDPSDGAGSRAKAEALLQKVRKSGRALLTEYESKQVLESYGIPVVETRVALTEDEALKIASEMGYPLVLKLYSETITHKTDVGGVQLNLNTVTAVRRAWRAIESSVSKKVGREHFRGVTIQPMIKLGGHELIIGSSIDPQFGPVLLFGAGGKLVEVFRDRAIALPPLNATLALRLMEQTRIFKALKGVRGENPIHLAALEELLVRFSQLVIEQPWIKEIDINPLLASAEGLVALDARVVLHENVTEEKLPRPAIRPYPMQYIKPWKLKDGTAVTIRPIRPEDEPLMAEFHLTLSERSVYYRYFGHLKVGQRVAHERLTRICFNDYDREIALVAERTERNEGHREILGVGRLTKLHGLNEAEFAIVVSDRWHGFGLGTELLRLLVQIGHEEKLERIIGHILPDNREMQHVCRRVGFKLHHEAGEGECVAEFAL